MSALWVEAPGGGYAFSMGNLYPIAEVLAILKPGHPKLGVSKIRLLEHQGAIHPTRAADGRLYYSAEEISSAMPRADW